MAKKKKVKTRKVKVNVRLFKCTDALFMAIGDKERAFECLTSEINEDGAKFTYRDDGGQVFRKEWSWRSVAKALGRQKCEYCLNPEGSDYVLLYDDMEVGM